MTLPRFRRGRPGADLAFLLAWVFGGLGLLWLIKETALWIFVGG